VASVISCVYCGGSHARPADVKRCWSESQRELDLGDDPQPAVARSAPTAAAVAAVRGPAQLGRNVLVSTGQTEPAAWAGCRRIVIDAAARADPAAPVAALRQAAADSNGLVIELDAEVWAHLAAVEEVERRPQWELGPGHTLHRDELRHLVAGNSVDARGDVPAWHRVQQALALGATPVVGGEAGDVALPDGTRVWIDGGAIRHTDPIDGVPVLHCLQLTHGRLELPLANATTAELAADQQAAVTHPGGSARIIAPAGSGKTRVLTERARHLLGAWCLPAAAVSLVAFNKRAQVEMQERTSDLPGLDVRTLNSIALAIVNGVPPFAPQRRQWRTIDEHDVRTILQRFVQTTRKLNVDPLAPWIDALSAVRLGLLDPAVVERRYGGDVDGLGEVWPRFRDALESAGAVDFDDQIRRAIDVLLTQPDARRAAQRACSVLLVDEFQDLTPAHMLLIRLLTASGGVVFGVGDDDQTIYGYNGADPSWLIDFASWFPGAGDHPLEVNYRCPADVVEVADRLLRHNRRRVAKTIRAAAPAGDRAGWSIVDGDDPVSATVHAVTAAIDAGAATSDIAVLTRVNASIAPVQIALGASGIPIAGGVGAEFADRVAVRAGLAWLRLAAGGALAPDDLAEASRRPSRGFSSRLRGWVSEQGSTDKLLRLADRLNEPKDAQRVIDLANDIVRLQALFASGADTSRLLGVLIDEIGLGGAVASLDRNRFGMNRAAQGDDLLALRHLARLQPAPRQFESWLRDGLFVKRDPSGVVLATVHRVKGQEWPHVVVHLAQDDVFPHRLAEDHEEERRLFHVAITRAARHVTIVAGDDPSPFLTELTNEPPERGPDPTPRLPRPASTPARRESAHPDHPLLDRGRVMAVVGLALVDQGQEWTIIELEPAAAVASRNGATRRFALGEKVETSGRQRGVLRPRTGDVDDASVRLFDLLRSYRDRVRDGKPAYTVFDDRTLAAIASALPDDLAGLAAVRGVGPAKLEQYGDDVLELAASAREPVTDPAGAVREA
jgi:DNA helicase-2/ATP-dependent DNA helicase PcrA